MPASPSETGSPSQARGFGKADADVICARVAAAPSSMQPGIPNIDALMPHIPSAVQQLGSVTKPITPGQRSSPGSGRLQRPPMNDIPQVSVFSSAQQAAAKPPGDVHIFAPHLTAIAKLALLLVPSATDALPGPPATPGSPAAPTPESRLAPASNAGSVGRVSLVASSPQAKHATTDQAPNQLLCGQCAGFVC